MGQQPRRLRCVDEVPDARWGGAFRLVPKCVREECAPHVQAPGLARAELAGRSGRGGGCGCGRAGTGVRARPGWAVTVSVSWGMRGEIGMA